MKKYIRTAGNKITHGAHWLSNVLTPKHQTRRWLWLPATILVAIAGAYLSLVSQSGAGAWFDAITGALVAVLLTVLVAFALWMTKVLIQRLGRHLGLLPVAAALTAAWLLHHIGDNFAYVLVAILFTGVYLLTVALLLLLKRERLLAACASLLVGGWLTLATVHWFVQEQHSESPVAELVAAYPETSNQALIEPGAYSVEHFTYGSGSDKRRADYAEDVRFQTPSVDASKMLESWNGWRGRMRSRAWGFSADELPLNAQVWYPRTDTNNEPLPLTLIVHGNSNMFNRSELGYAWLAEHLASRGHIVASIDQNFLNGGGVLYDGLSPENDARGWLLLEHLKQWQQWNQDEDHPFYGRVDMDRITLMGHSRGGEAVYLAGVFNQLSHYPDNALLEFDYDFGISGIVAIAPVDGQFRPSGKSAVLENTNFFTIHGGHDGDAFFFHGDRQYFRAQPNYAEGQFKATLYLHHANHGQFNTQWGDRDYAGLYGQTLNTKVLLSGEAQRQAAKGYFTAFVEYDSAQDSELFCDPELAGVILPTDVIIARCQTAERTVLANFEDGIDLTQGNAAQIHAHGLQLWKEAQLTFRQGTRERGGVWLGWDAETEEAQQPAFYELRLDQGLRSTDTLHFELAQLDQDPPGYEGERDGLSPAADFIVELEDASGRVMQRRVSEYGGIVPPLPARHVREEKLLGLFGLEQVMSNVFSNHLITEAVMQSIAIPLESFAANGLELDDIRAIRFIFDQGAAVIMIDEVSVSSR